MAVEVLSFAEMCRREEAILRRGMHFRPRNRYSVILTSTRPDAPYADRIDEEGLTLLYEGHDDPSASAAGLDPKAVDQPGRTASGRPSQNGRFFEAARAYREGEAPPEIVRVYEKIRPGAWADLGFFDLVDARREHDGRRMAFRFEFRKPVPRRASRRECGP